MIPAPLVLVEPVPAPCPVCWGWRVVWLRRPDKVSPWRHVRCLACCHGVQVGLPKEDR